MEDETSKSYQSRLKSHLELLIDFEEVNGDEELMTIYPCPFCEEDFDLLELCFHIDLDHPIEAESGCYLYSDYSHLKSKSHKHDSYQTLSFSRKGRRDGHWKSCSDELSPVMPTSKTTCDPFLSFLCGATASGEHENVQLDSSSEASIEEIHSHDTVLERDVPPSLSHKDQVEKARRSEFVQGLLLSTILDPDL
ncbi:drought-induced protein [Medicago truncatula]|uniref:Drought-induced protein n=1 Tax=Medicago truncatula TaxID=3880 RepID=A0A072U404_MEDTR|nr:drought-induced protein [Medicago truncatula]